VQIAFARSLEKQGLRDQAMGRYADALKQDPDRADALARLAVLSAEQGKFGEAEGMFGKALALHPGDPDLYCSMGYSLYLQRRWAEAEMNLRQALALRPDHARAHNNLGLVLAHSDRPAEALAEFRRAGSPEADARVNLAFALSLEGRCPEAREHYQRALAADPSSVAAKKGLRKLEKLEAVLAKGVGGQPDGASARRGPVEPVSHSEVATGREK
jgi:Flp pilus assembly protein TadD